MAAPTSNIDIANLALDRIGQAAITSVDTPTTPTEDVIARHYDATRREVLRAFVFNFAKKYATLTASGTETPAFGFGTAYAVPNDFIRLLGIGDVTLNADIPGMQYDVVNGFLYTDAGSSAGLNIYYTFDNTTVSKYDPLFVRLFTLQLAANLAYKFTLKPSLIAGILQELQDVALKAAAAAGQEKPPRRIQRSRLRDVRRSSGTYRDNRYV